MTSISALFLNHSISFFIIFIEVLRQHKNSSSKTFVSISNNFKYQQLSRVTRLVIIQEYIMYFIIFCVSVSTTKTIISHRALGNQLGFMTSLSEEEVYFTSGFQRAFRYIHHNINAGRNPEEIGNNHGFQEITMDTRKSNWIPGNHQGDTVTYTRRYGISSFQSHVMQIANDITTQNTCN